MKPDMPRLMIVLMLSGLILGCSDFHLFGQSELKLRLDMKNPTVQTKVFEDFVGTKLKTAEDFCTKNRTFLGIQPNGRVVCSGLAEEFEPELARRICENYKMEFVEITDGVIICKGKEA